MKIVSHITGSKLLFIGIGLGQEDEPFSTESGIMFQSVVASLAITPNLIELRKDDFEDEEVTEEVKNELINIINNTNIDKIVFMGKQAAKQLTPSVLSSTSFNNLNSMGFLSSKEFPDKKVAFIYHPKFILNNVEGNKLNALSVYSDRIETLLLNSDKSSLEVHKLQVTLDEFIELIPTIEKEDFIGVDVETNGAPLWTKEWVLRGMSIAVQPKGKDQIYSWWFNVEEATDDQKKIILAFFKRISKKLWAFNCSYEIQSFWIWLGEFIKIQDALVLITMNSARSNLKTAVRRYLGVDFWESDVGAFLDLFKRVFKDMDRAKVDTNSIINHDKTSWKDLSIHLEESGLSTALIKDLSEMASDFEESDIIDGIRKYPYEWAAVPENVLAPYCCYDAGYTVPLARMFYDKFKSGYGVYICHPWLASVFEANGIVWDEDRARIEEEQYLKDMIESLSFLIQNFTEISDEHKLEARDIMSWKLPHTFKWYTPTGQEREAVCATEYDRLNELKGIFNPGSNSEPSRQKFWKQYLNSDVELATFTFGFINELRFRGVWEEVLIHISKEVELNIPEGKSLEYCYLRSVPFGEIIEKIVDYPNHYKNETANIILNSLVSVEETYKKEFTGRFAKEVMGAQYEIQSMFFNVDIDDPSTWNDEFKILFHLQKYKKIGKCLSTNIAGGTGRGSAYQFDKLNLQGPTARGEQFYSSNNREQVSKWILNTQFNSLSAITHRWTSGFHIIPAGSSVRECLIPHSEDGVWIHADFSQAELVVLAFFSQDPEMMKIFLEGGDMHRYIASQIFNKSMEDVTPEERRGSKAVSFGIIYGKSVENTAVDVTNGDVPKAQAMFDAFFERFPGIKDWMDERDVEVDDIGKVTNLFGAYIEIDTDAPGNAKYRQGHNYPIQSTSSMIAGTSMWQVQEYCWNNEIPQLSYGFTHDSLDSSTPIDSIFDFLQSLRTVMQDNLYKNLGTPMKIDYEVGVNGYQLCEMSGINVEENTISFELEGLERDVTDLLDKFRNYSKWSIEEVKETKRKTIHTSWSEMFAAKAAYKTTWGTTQEKVTYEVQLAA